MTGTLSTFLRRMASPRLLGRVATNSAINLFQTPAFILSYHRIGKVPTPHDPMSLTVSPENFRLQLQVLKERFLVTSLSSLVRAQPWNDRPLVALTFDDGYHDNLTEALPILEEFGLPGTIFVATEHLQSGERYWWDHLFRLLYETAPIAPREFDIDMGALRVHYSLATRDRFLDEAVAFCQMSPPSESKIFCARLREELRAREPDPAPDRILTIEETRHIASHPLIEIGSHGNTHMSFSLLNAEQQLQELTSSKAAIESWLGRPVRHFAYPYGTQEHVQADLSNRCLMAGYESGVTTISGQVRSWTPRGLLPRIFVQNIGASKFHNLLNKAFFI
ncbi:MAG: polysaccharide deacetylase family protein [Bdellovibrionales bacterium]|nr:polysaccharide deacetylase family protein [Bdellovibrionales bacterium]